VPDGRRVLSIGRNERAIVNVIGLSAHYHESACCLLRDGRLVAAAEEERFSRVKHDGRIPVRAFSHCLAAGGIDITEVDCVAYYESPKKKLARQLWAGRPLGGTRDPRWIDPLLPERQIREVLGYEGPIEQLEHHLSHAAAAFFYSGFPDAAILTVDGVGEWATTTYGRGAGAAIELFEEVVFPHSLGLLYSTLTGYLGFRVNSGEYKVMGLAPYGEPRYVDALRQLITSGPGGQYQLDPQYFDFLTGERMYSDRLCELLGADARAPGAPIEQFHKDVARSLQLVLEEILLEKVHYLAQRVRSRNLCMAGGVALNCVANGRLLREGPFRRLFVQPAAGDAGSALGAAALAWLKRSGGEAIAPLTNVYLGPRYSGDEVARLIAGAGIAALDFRAREAELLEAVVDRLVAGQVIGWFQGAMEFGPRALGARSLLADPRDPGMRERLNRLVKRREAFRPFAPSVLAQHASEHFELDHPSPFMLETCAVRSPLSLPAITHVDGSARPQTVDPAEAPRFAALLEAFRRRTGCPILVNTSFNVRGEPIVCTPEDALYCLADSGIDAVVIEDTVIDRSMLPPSWHNAVRYHRSLIADDEGGRISETVYTFI
jgi:carbamoyltransferase